MSPNPASPNPTTPDPTSQPNPDLKAPASPGDIRPATPANTAPPTAGSPVATATETSDPTPAEVALPAIPAPAEHAPTPAEPANNPGHTAQPAPSANPAAEPLSSPQAEQRPADPADPDDVHTAPTPGNNAADQAVLAASRRHTRRSFVVAGLATAAGAGLYAYLNLGPTDEMQPVPIRRAFQFSALLSRDNPLDHALAPTYPLSRAETLRVNGIYGLKKALVPESWRLQLVGARANPQDPRYTNDVTAWEYEYTKAADTEDKGHDTKVDPKLQIAARMAPESMQGKAAEDENHTGRKPRGSEEAGESHSTLDPGTPGLLLRIEDILHLPRHELVTQFKCIEGWSQIVHWAGVRMSDFLEAYPPEPINGKDPRYVYMETPDGDFYTGYDLHIMRHPQTLLVTEMMGAPLTQFHGAPLRLHMPTKYGYKQIKRIGLIAYTNHKPDDYWTRLGYDWFAGL